MTQRHFKSELDSIVKEIVAPIFKELGFKKKGYNFYRGYGEVGQAFNIQNSRWNSKEDKSFVFNIGLIDKVVYKQVNNIAPPPFPKEVDCDIRLRLGNLTDKADGWYNLNSTTELDKLKEQIRHDLKLYVVPFFEDFKEPEKWTRIFKWKHKVLVHPLSEFLLKLKYVNKSSAADFLNQVYNEAQLSKSESCQKGEKTKDFSQPPNKDWIKEIETVARDKNIELKIRTTTPYKNNGEVSAKSKINSENGFWIKFKDFFN